MAIFHITPTTSRLVTPIFQPAFENDSPGADTLIVDQGAFLISVNGGAGALLAATGAWTVTVNGSIVAGVGVVSQFTDGIFLAAGNSAISTITIGADGQVEGLTGLAMFSSANIHNAGTITGSGGAGILISNGGAHTITNSGTIRGPNAGITDNSGVSNDTVTNSGVINGDVALGDGTNHLTNSGTIDGFVVGGNGSDTVTNFAIVADVMKSGTITGGVFLGAGNDKFTGGANAETVQDGDGADMVTLGGGNDRYIAIGNAGADGIDTVRGGAGSDTYDASAANSPCAINLDTVAHDLGPISPGAGPVAANTAKGTDISGTTKDTISGFENAKGGAASDLIYGSAAANVLDGGGSGDNLLGFGGKDTLIGGAGADGLAGGAGADTLIGGLDGDFFQYLAITDSGITAATRDVITDFQQGSDKIDLSFIDANTKNTAGTNDAFNFVGTNIPTGFSGNPGELHAYWNATGQIVEGDVNGDKKADFSIALQDPLHAITLSSGDFFL